jgi:hypothetical protein
MKFQVISNSDKEIETKQQMEMRCRAKEKKKSIGCQILRDSFFFPWFFCHNLLCNPPCGCNKIGKRETPEKT